MVEATPRTFLRSAKNVFDEGEMLSVRRGNETQNIMRGFLKSNEVPKERNRVDGDRRRVNRGAKSHRIGEGLFLVNLLNGLLIFVNILLMGLVVFAFYMLFTVDS